MSAPTKQNIRNLQQQNNKAASGWSSPKLNSQIGSAKQLPLQAHNHISNPQLACQPPFMPFKKSFDHSVEPHNNIFKPHSNQRLVPLRVVHQQRGGNQIQQSKAQDVFTTEYRQTFHRPYKSQQVTPANKMQVRDLQPGKVGLCIQPAASQNSNVNNFSQTNNNDASLPEFIEKEQKHEPLHSEEQASASGDLAPEKSAQPNTDRQRAPDAGKEEKPQEKIESTSLISDKTQLQNELVKNCFQQFMIENEDYFKHLSGKCTCTNQDETHKKCPYYQKQIRPNISGFLASQYQQNFISKKLNEKEVTINMRFYEQKHDEKHFDLRSTHQVEFIKKEDPSTHIRKRKPRYEFDPYPPGLSSYSHEYLNWGTAPFSPLKQSNLRTTNEKMKFVGNSSYQQDFRQYPISQSTQQLSFKPVPNKGKIQLPLLTDTTTKQYYSGYKAQPIPQKFLVPNQLTVGSPSFAGQFETLMQKSYQGYKGGATRFFLPPNKAQTTLYQKIQNLNQPDQQAPLN